MENMENIKKSLKLFENQKAALGSVINPLLEKYDLEKKEILEVCQIGKFVQQVNAEIQITDKPKPPSPDFVINYRGKLIGLEHTRVLNKNASRYLKIETLLNYAQQEFEKKYPGDNVIASIAIKDDEFNYKKKDKADIAKNIADYVQWTRLGIEFKLPEFIASIEITSHTEVSFWFDEKDWQTAEYLTRERLKTEILKKEPKITEYKTSKQKLSEYWLVLMIGSLNSVSYKLNKLENYKMDSKYDQVYLMADYDADVVRIK